MALFYRASIVKEKIIFWSDIRSDLIDVTLNEDGGEGNFLSSQIYDDCSVSKTCFGVPENCVSSKNCEYMGTFYVESGKYFFEVKSPSIP